jgi:hypothetical protein
MKYERGNWKVVRDGAGPIIPNTNGLDHFIAEVLYLAVPGVPIGHILYCSPAKFFLT